MRHSGLSTAIVLAALLAGCATTPKATDTVPVGIPSRANLPEVPADIRACFNTALSNPPDRDLTIDEVERAWKQDRYAAVVMRTCGKRFLAWYNVLRAGWR